MEVIHGGQVFPYMPRPPHSFIYPRGIQSCLTYCADIQPIWPEGICTLSQSRWTSITRRRVPAFTWAITAKVSPGPCLTLTRWAVTVPVHLTLLFLIFTTTCTCLVVKTLAVSTMILVTMMGSPAGGTSKLACSTSPIPWPSFWLCFRKYHELRKRHGKVQRVYCLSGIHQGFVYDALRYSPVDYDFARCYDDTLYLRS